MASLLALCLAAGCKAQPASQGTQDLALNRHIAVMVRSQFNVPADFSVTLGDRKPSQIPGYDTLPVTLAHGAKKTVVDFLISTDGKTLARLEKFDLDKDPSFSIDVAGRPIRGNPAAKVTVINFDDLECPFCARMHAEIFPAVTDRYKDQVRIVYRDFPLESIHPWALRAAIDANCLGAASTPAYWNYVDYVHAHASEILDDDKSVPKAYSKLDGLAMDEGARQKLNAVDLAACVTKQDSRKIRASIQDGEADTLRVDATPALFVNGEKVDGVVTLDELYHVIDQALIAAGQTPPPAPTPASPAPAATPLPPATKPGS